MSIEEDIKALDEIAEGFEKLSSEICARTDLRAMWEGRAKGIRQAITLIKAHLKGQSNNPLTMEELREMEGEPVWITDIVDGVVFGEWWALIFSVEEDAICFSTKESGDDSRLFSLYGTGWLAYRRSRTP